jgi:hypothetical protein
MKNYQMQRQFSGNFEHFECVLLSLGKLNPSAVASQRNLESFGGILINVLLHLVS